MRIEIIEPIHRDMLSNHCWHLDNIATLLQDDGVIYKNAKVVNVTDDIVTIRAKYNSKDSYIFVGREGALISDVKYYKGE